MEGLEPPMSMTAGLQPAERPVARHPHVGAVGIHLEVACPIDGLFSAPGCVRYRSYRILPALLATDMPGTRVVSQGCQESNLIDVGFGDRPATSASPPWHTKRPPVWVALDSALMMDLREIQSRATS